MLREPISDGRAELRELCSHFFGYAFPVQNQEEAEQKLAHLNKRYPDATHICYAYRLGTDGLSFRASDNGEPKYSAGIPILNQIKSAALTNVLVAVVRYYGGTKLGVPGLVRAYGGAATGALAEITSEPAFTSFKEKFTVPPAKAGIVYDLARKHNATTSLDETRDDGWQTIAVSGKGDPKFLIALIQARLI